MMNQTNSDNTKIALDRDKDSVSVPGDNKGQRKLRKSFALAEKIMKTINQEEK
jgi:hypothetical protein